MIFLEPVTFDEALRAHDAKSLLPTTGRTRDFAKVRGDIKRRSMFSATVALAEPLQALSSVVRGITAGAMDQASARLAIKQVWEKIGYRPDPEQIGGILDLGSDARINLQIETNVATVSGAGWYEQGQDEAVLDEFPAWELFDTSPGGDRKGRRDWADRWHQAGGNFPDGRMVALVDAEVWDNLGDPALFPDALGNRFAPFAFGTKWRTRDVPRDEAIALGLIDADTQVQPVPLDLNDGLQAAPDIRDAALRAELERTGVGRFEGGVFKFFGGGA